MPIFDAARVLSIKHNVRARSAAERLRGAVAKGVAAFGTVEGILDAHLTILASVVSQQLVDTEAGVPLSGRVAPDGLSKVESKQLKAALRRVDAALELAAEGRI